MDIITIFESWGLVIGADCLTLPFVAGAIYMFLDSIFYPML